MKASGSRDKGNRFERQVAKAVQDAFNVGPTECYRTPLSGGHPFGPSGDLCISEKLAKRFPFYVECKHHRSFLVRHIMSPTALLQGWLDTINRQRGDRYGMLATKGNNSPELAIVTERLTPRPELTTFEARLRLGRDRWWVYHLSQFLEGWSRSHR